MRTETFLSVLIKDNLNNNSLVGINLQIIKLVFSFIKSAAFYTTGTPEEIAACAASFTGEYLKAKLVQSKVAKSTDKEERS